MAIIDFKKHIRFILKGVYDFDCMKSALHIKSTFITLPATETTAVKYHEDS